eukprot:g56995.t1
MLLCWLRGYDVVLVPRLCCCVGSEALLLCGFRGYVDVGSEAMLLRWFRGHVKSEEAGCMVEHSTRERGRLITHAGGDDGPDKPRTERFQDAVCSSLSRALLDNHA